MYSNNTGNLSPSLYNFNFFIAKDIRLIASQRLILKSISEVEFSPHKPLPPSPIHICHVMS